MPIMERASRQTSWGTDWTVEMRVWMQRAGLAMLDESQAELLTAIDRVHSISAAARSIGISYRHAWKMVQAANAAAGIELVEAAVGGVRGGGARLTDRGRFAVEVLEQLREELRAKGADALRRIVSPAGDAACTLHLAAAISLQEAVGQILTEYALLRPLIRVRAVFGASNELADHLQAGSPCDLFISADPTHIDRLMEKGLIEPRSRRELAVNGLAAVGPVGKAMPVRKASDLLNAAVKHVALAEPACPLGKLSQSYLESIGLYEELRSKAIFVGNSRGILAAIQSGAAEAGLAFASDAAKSNACKMLFQAPAAHVSAEIVGAVSRHAGSPDEARALADFFVSAAARRCFRRCGFRPIKSNPERAVASSSD